MKRLLPLLVVVALAGALLAPLASPDHRAQAQGVFGCPFDSQRDCDRLIDAIDNTATIESVYVSEFVVNLTVAVDDNPANLGFVASGPTTIGENGDVVGLEWAAVLDTNDNPNPFNLRLVDGVLYVDIRPNEDDDSWLAYDPVDVGTEGLTDLTGIFNTLNFGRLMTALNDIGDGVRWSVGGQTEVDGQPAYLYYARFSTASLLQTSYVYEQIKLFMVQILQDLGLDLLEDEALSFLVDLVVTTVADQLGGTDFTLEWVVGDAEPLIYGLSLVGEGAIDLSVLGTFDEGMSALPGDFSYQLDVAIDLSDHNAIYQIERPEMVEGAGTALINELLQILFGLLPDGVSA